MLREVAEESEGMYPSGGEKMRFVNGMLPPAKLAEESLVCGQAAIEMSAVFCELPTLSFELEVMGDKRPIERRRPIGDEVVFLKRPIERRRPIGDEVVFLNPSLVIGVVGRELNGCEVVNIVVRMPVAEGKFR